jgi:hypothetical protein
MRVPDEGDSRNALCALKISVCYFPEKILGKHYKYKQKMHSDITKKNKNAHMYYKDKHK